MDKTKKFIYNSIQYYYINDNNEFYIGMKKCFTFFELVEEPNKKLKYLEDAYNIIKNIYELSANSSEINYFIFILMWEYYIIHICPITFYSSMLKIHLFIRKDLLTKIQIKLLFQIKEAIKNILNESIKIITNEYEE